MTDFRPWPNGTTKMDWMDRNCDRCSKMGKIDRSSGASECEIETVLSLSAIGPDAFPEERGAQVAARLKWDRSTYIGHDCPERILGTEKGKR